MLTNTPWRQRFLLFDLLLNLKDGQKVVLVASANHGDGKTYIAKRLEEAFNAIGKKVILINADLRKAGGKQHPADVLASAEFAQQMADAKATNDFIIIDSPAMNEYNDALQLAAFADATLYVAKAGKTQKSDLESLNSNSNLPNPMLVLNN